ncbi:hypothetical protein SUGI_0638610 [Cryptomeria japonica]|nr:hypothetical protein SUGI_0638610 [Cryptomeria japonica]
MTPLKTCKSLLTIVICLISITFITCQQIPEPVSGLAYGFYKSSCPRAEEIVREELGYFLNNNITSVGGFLRIPYHDCFVQGCDASILINATDGELSSLPNQSLRPEVLQEIEKIKEKVEAACPNTVSCADIVVLAGRDSVHLSKGPYFEVPTGRRDSLNYVLGSDITSAQLPPPNSTVTQLITRFVLDGLSGLDLVALSGAHSVGTAHCSAFINSLFPLSNRLTSSFAQELLQICPNQRSNNLTVMDKATPFVFDNKYFINLVEGLVLFDSDTALLQNSQTSSAVKSFADDQQEFFGQFAESYIKMSMINVKTGSTGNIRKVCSLLNSESTNHKNLTGSMNMMYAETDTIRTAS